MKFCQKCGKEIADEAVICPGCGCAVEGAAKPQASGGNDGLAVAAKVFLILGCITDGWLYLLHIIFFGGLAIFLVPFLPLAWCLPITISICGRMKRNEPVGTGLKVCALLFVNLIAGILLLCRNDEQ